MIKDKILEYKKLNPSLTYYDLVKIFGLSLVNLFNLLEINNYKIDKFNQLRFYDTKGNVTYIENWDSSWDKFEYDTNDKLIYTENSNGVWCKWGHDANGKLVYEKHSNGYKYKF